MSTDTAPTTSGVPGDNFVTDLGLHVAHADDGTVTGWLEAGPRHHQPYGITHGGVYCSIVETLASHAAAQVAQRTGDLVVGVSNHTDFLRPHREGRLEATAEAIHLGRSSQLWLVTVTRAGDGKIVARGQVRMQQVPPERMSATTS